MNTKLLSAFVAVAMINGCATRGANYEPLIDLRGTESKPIAQDIYDCQQYAKHALDAAGGAVAGAIAGALLMAIIMPRGFRNYGAGQGAAVGGVAGAAQANDTQETIIKRCMAGRGYNVLN
jgi:outer membrane lipoprotein SlyB